MRNYTKFTIFVGLLFLCLILANYFINLKITRSVLSDLQTSSIKNASFQIEKWVERRIVQIELIKKLISQNNYLTQKHEIENIIKENTLATNFFYGYVVYGNNVITNRRLKNQKQSDTSNQLWENTLKNNAIAISKPHKSIFIDDELAISICTPIKDKTQTKGVLCGEVFLSYLQDKVLSTYYAYDGSTFLIDENKTIIMHENKNLISKTFDVEFEKNKNTIFADKNYEDFIFSKAFIKYANWYLISQLDKDKVYEKVNFQLKINFIIYFISLLIFIWLNILFGRYKKLNEKNLRNSKLLLSTFANSVERGFLVANKSHEITFSNNRIIQLLEQGKLYTDKERDLNSLDTIFSTMPNGIGASLKKIIAQVKKENTTKRKTFQFYSNKNKIFLFFTFIPIKDKNNNYNGAICIIEDTTKATMADENKKEQEGILFQQKKMAALGEMIGAISHQWKQPLSSLVLLLENLLQFQQMEKLDEKVLAKNIDYALKNVNFLSNTIDTFRNFYLPNKKAQEFDIVEAINDTLFILKPYFKNFNINISVNFSENKYPSYNYKNEFQQVIGALLVNAKDALLQKKNMQDMNIEIEIISSDMIYEILVKDNGTGIDLSIKDYLFQAFQTTKKHKDGSGSGLYLSKLIAKNKLDGDLTLQNASNPTIFSLIIKKHKRKSNAR